MYTICTRASISRQELDTPTLYALIWILRSIDSQWFSWAHHTVKEFLEAAELHDSHPAPPQRYEDCLDGLIKMQAQLLYRCDWRMALNWTKDITPAIQRLSSCSAKHTFHWLCSLSSDHLAPITPATSEAPAHLSTQPVCRQTASSEDHHGCQQPAPLASMFPPAQHPPVQALPGTTYDAPKNSQAGTSSRSFSASRSYQALLDITTQTCNTGGLNGSYWTTDTRRSHRRTKPRNGHR